MNLQNEQKKCPFNGLASGEPSGRTACGEPGRTTCGEQVYGERSRTSRTILIVSAIIFCVFILVAAGSTLWDRDEPRYASVTLEMVKSGNYLIPTLDGKPWPDKPPLMYWLMSVPVRLIGPTALACRLWSVLGTVAACVLTFFIGKKLFSYKTGLLSMLILASSLLVLFIGTAAIADGIVLPFMLASMLIFIIALQSKFKIMHILLLGITLGLGALTKGPIGLLPVLVMLTVSWLNPKTNKNNLRIFALICLAAAALLGCLIFHAMPKLSHILLSAIILGLWALAEGQTGLLLVLVTLVTYVVIWLNRNNLRMFLSVCLAAVLGCLIFLLWAIPANKAAGGNFLHVFLGRHVIGRALNPMEHHGGNWLLFLPYYIPIIIAGFFPFILHLPGAISACLGGRVGSRQTKFLLISWILSILLLMSLAATKLPHYILFIWPALALITAATIEAAQSLPVEHIGQARLGGLTERDKKWLRGGVWFFGPVAFVLAAACFAGPFILQTQTGLHIPPLNWSGPLCGLILIIMAASAIYFQLKEQFLKSSAALLAGLAVFLIPLLLGVLPGLEQIKIPPAIAKIINEKTGPETPVCVYKFNEPSLNFYIGRPACGKPSRTTRGEPSRTTKELAGEKDVADWASQTQNGILVIPKNLLDEICKKFPGLQTEMIGSKKGINYSKGTLLDVAVVIVNKIELK